MPVQPNNRFTPGPEDRGQPEHFPAKPKWGFFGARVENSRVRSLGN